MRNIGSEIWVSAAWLLTLLVLPFWDVQYGIVMKEAFSQYPAIIKPLSVLLMASFPLGILSAHAVYGEAKKQSAAYLLLGSVVASLGLLILYYSDYVSAVV